MREVIRDRRKREGTKVGRKNGKEGRMENDGK